jgi:hypothetical protein
MTDDDMARLIARKQARIPARWLPVLAEMIKNSCARSQEIDYDTIAEMVLWMFIDEPEFFDGQDHLIGCMGTREARHLGIIGPPNPDMTLEEQARVDRWKAECREYFESVEKAERKYGN